MLIIKVFSTSFRPEIVKDETTEYVEGLTRVHETSGVVREEAGGVIFVFLDDFAKKSEWLGKREVSVSFLGNLGFWTVEQAMLRGLFNARVAYFALIGEAHDLEPGADWEALVECRNPTLANCGGEAQHSQSWGFGVLWDCQMFRVRRQGAKHLALGCS